MKKLTFQLVTIITLILSSCIGNASTSTPISNEDAVVTLVATMLSGIPTNTPLPEPTATLTPEPPAILPRSLYYLAQDANGKSQIFRMSRDGTAITQITFEQDGVGGFDISPIDGTIVYVAQNNLITANPNGEDRQVLVEDLNLRPFSPSWSPDGKTIVYASGKDTLIYSIATGSKEMLLSGSETDWKWPESFSPDGKKLIVRRHRIPSAPGGEVFIYDFASRTLTPMAGTVQYDTCFNDYVAWVTPDTFFCYGYIFAGASIPGLRRVNAMDGSVETLIGSATCSPCLPVAAPHQDAAGNLYYLFGETYNVNPTYPLLSLVQSASDGVTDRVVLRPETFYALYTLWAPDGSALLIVQNDGTTSKPVNLILVPVDPSLPVVTIMSDASKIGYQLRWGP